MFPPRVVLAATDFSDTSRGALALAARLARQCGAALHVLHAEDPMLAAAAEHEGIDLLRETREELDGFVASAWPAAECTPTSHVEAGAAEDVIRQVAERERADVVVVGSRGMSGATRLVFGSTTERLLRRAQVPVLVAPDGWAPARQDSPDLTGTGPVIAAIDFAPPSIAAAEAACQLASTLGTGVEMVHVVPSLSVPERWRLHAEGAIRERVTTAKAELATAAKRVPCGARLTLRVETGAAPASLADISEPAPGRSPILVLGRRTGSADAAPGAIAYRVLSMVHVPVLVYVAPHASAT